MIVFGATIGGGTALYDFVFVVLELFEFIDVERVPFVLLLAVVDGLEGFPVEEESDLVLGIVDLFDCDTWEFDVASIPILESRQDKYQINNLNILNPLGSLPSNCNENASAELEVWDFLGTLVTLSSSVICCKSSIFTKVWDDYRI